MVNKGFFGRTFCCARSVTETTAPPVPAGVFTLTESIGQPSSAHSADFDMAKEAAQERNRIRRASAISYRSCASSVGTFRSLSCSSLQSAVSKNTGNYDYYSVYSNNSGRASFNSCSS